ncbi:hypothetical protein SAMN06265222_11581 [Neorhodopirellula lusitana]|uniref:Uncharacterized protein n=1 Tax=Neorhodopirellula lusitana TaxID=445327 RepID=A0ABY1QJH5_9BACT|nr:hypothetical protein [Neorhodopirellula lusitana]SMP72398.1 hypothetical protein SAMN06265222_11581 [Neorhodopirellula lusitana]
MSVVQTIRNGCGRDTDRDNFQRSCWRFAFHGNTPRSLRALVAAAVVLSVVAVAQLL